jgi:hypothetical protein
MTRGGSRALCSMFAKHGIDFPSPSQNVHCQTEHLGREHRGELLPRVVILRNQRGMLHRVLAHEIRGERTRLDQRHLDTACGDLLRERLRASAKSTIQDCIIAEKGAR